MEDRENFYTVRGYELLERHKKQMTPSLEDYLEMIYRNLAEKGLIRVHELADLLHVKPSSVSKMLSKLNDLELIDYEKYGVIRLTGHGRELGEYLLWRHNVVSSFFNLLCRDDDRHFTETERIEHILERNTVVSLAKMVLFFETHPEIKEKLSESLSCGE